MLINWQAVKRDWWWHWWQLSRSIFHIQWYLFIHKNNNANNEIWWSWNCLFYTICNLYTYVYIHTSHKSIQPVLNYHFYPIPRTKKVKLVDALFICVPTALRITWFIFLILFLYNDFVCLGRIQNTPPDNMRSLLYENHNSSYLGEGSKRDDDLNLTLVYF